MNKTLKTIGWILVALGILGILADAGALVVGHRLAENRQAFVQQWNGSNNQPKLNPPENGQRNINPREGFMPRSGYRGEFLHRGGYMRIRPAGFFFLPIFFFALGPVMAVVGAVILIVNRSPKEKKEKKEDKEKSEEKETKKGKSKK